MSVDIIGTISIIIKLGTEIKSRLDSLNQAAEEIQLVTTNLSLLLKILENPVNDTLIRTHAIELAIVLDVLQSIANSCTKCARALDVDVPGATNAIKRNRGHGQRFIKRLQAFVRIPDLLAEIQSKATHLQQINTVLSALILQDVRLQQERTSDNETLRSTSVGPRVVSLDLELGTTFAGIDQVVRNLLQECEQLRRQLQNAVLRPETSMIEAFRSQNPEAVSFWRDNFQRNELTPSALRYETVYISWARFVHTIESTIILKEIPTGFYKVGSSDIQVERGSRYLIDRSGTRHLSSIRPLWLPALRQALDPLHKGYVKPQDYFSLLHESSLSETLKRLVFESSGYGAIVECERASRDLPFPAAIESPSDHVGWTSAQIIAVPTPSDLGIVSDQELVASSSKVFFSNFQETHQDIYVYVRYLQTGQIERKSLVTQVRPAAAIALGAEVSIYYKLDSDDHAWSSDLQITQFQACSNGQYVVTTGIGSAASTFSITPPKGSFYTTSNNNIDSIPAKHQLSYAFLGSSKVFRQPPKVGEKIQIEFDGSWYDSRVTLVDGDEIEYVDWNDLNDRSQGSSIDVEDDRQEDAGCFSFPDDLLSKLGKGTRRLWRPWRRDIKRYDVRPYRRFHIGDLIDAPVMYLDFRNRWHTFNDSQLYLPARIIVIQGDQYVVQFDPDCLTYGWWPGRVAKGEEIELVSGSGLIVKNPFDNDCVTLSMDLIRPLSTRPHPVLGIQTVKPPGWAAYQGVHLRNLEDLLEQSLWGNTGGSMQP